LGEGLSNVWGKLKPPCLGLSSAASAEVAFGGQSRIGPMC